MKRMSENGFIPDINDAELGNREPFNGLEIFIDYLKNQSPYPITIFCSLKYLRHLANEENLTHTES